MSAQDLEQRARQLLAAEYPDDPDYAEYLIVGESIDLFDDDARALRAIVAAFRQQPAPVVDDAMVERACGAYLSNGLGGGSVSHSAMRDALTAALARAQGVQS